MKPLLSLVLVVWLVAGANAEGLLRRMDHWTPFMERIDNHDFLVIENKLKESGSDGSILTIYRGSEDEVGTSILLKQSPQGGYALELMEHDHHGKRVTKKIKFPADVAERLLRVIEFALTKQVYAPAGTPPKPGSSGGAIWLKLKLDARTEASGVVIFGRCLVGETPSLSPFLDLLWKLGKCAKGESDEYSPFVEVDIAISNLRQSYPQ